MFSLLHSVHTQFLLTLIYVVYPHELFCNQNTFQGQSICNPDLECIYNILKLKEEQSKLIQNLKCFWIVCLIFKEFSWMYFKYNPEWMVFETSRKTKIATFEIQMKSITEHVQACQKIELQNQNKLFKIFQSRGRMSFARCVRQPFRCPMPESPCRQRTGPTRSEDRQGRKWRLPRRATVTWS